MTTPHSARSRQGYHESQPAKPSKPLEYVQQNHSMVDISSITPGTRQPHDPSPKTDVYGWYSSPAHPPPMQPPPPIPPKVAGGIRGSNSGYTDAQRPNAQKFRGSSGPEGNEFMAELEGDMVGLGLSNVHIDDGKKARDTLKKKGKRGPDTEAIAQAIVNQSRAPPGKRKIRVLSLDGGGIRGYSTLVILSDIMHRIHVLINKNIPVAPHQLPLPCDFFDIIGGNGTGGLIALMLGRMRMDVESCKEYYEALTRYVFYTDKTILGLPYGKTLFKASRLEEAIKVCVREGTRYDHLPLLHYLPLARRDSMHGATSPPQIQPASTIRSHGSRKGSWPYNRRVSTPTNSHDCGTSSTFSSFSSNSAVGANDHRFSKSGGEYSSFAAARGGRVDNTLGNPDTPLYDHRIGACKTLVTTSYISSDRGSLPVILRSYQTARDPGTVSTRATIWQAGRATCAYRSAFKPITIANVQFLDEGYGKYNPALAVLDEALAKETWHDTEDVVVDDRDPEIGVFISIGTGKKLGSQHGDGYGGLRKEKPLWWESMGMLEQYAEAKKRLLEKLEDCETVHQTLLGGELMRRGVDPTNYFRFNVEVGVGEFGMNEWNRLAEVSTGTRRYMDRPEVNRGVTTCAEKLVDIWHENEMQEKRKLEGPPPVDDVPQLEAAPVHADIDEDAQRRKEREKRRAARKASASGKGGAKHGSPPMSPNSISELEADIDQATSEWSSSQHTGSHSGSDGEFYPPSKHVTPIPQQPYRQQQQQQQQPQPPQPPPQEYHAFSPLPPQPPPQEYHAFSPLPPQRPAQYQPPQHISQWVNQLPGQRPPQQYDHPIKIPTPEDFLPKIVTSPPPPDDEVSDLPEDYFSGGPNPEIRVISPTTVAGDETPPGTPRQLRKQRSIEGDRQARREKRERKLKKERGRGREENKVMVGGREGI